MAKQENGLSKKEQIAVRREQEQEQFEREKQQKVLVKRLGIFAAIVVFVLGSWWAIAKSSKPEQPPPGTQVKDLGQDHIADIAGVSYDSNPPTSGSHFAIWAKRGVYPYQISDGYLIHSLEHGYIVMSYNCASLQKSGETLRYNQDDPLTTTTVTEEEMGAPFTPENAPKAETQLPKEFSGDNCKQLVSELSTFLSDWQRVVIVPRPNLDTKIALTAWGRIEKLSEFDKEKISAFVTSYHNTGPEKTVE